jgi:hypothetical protein
VIFGFLRGRPLLRFTSKGASSLLGLLASLLLVSSLPASFIVILLIWTSNTRYSLTEVARKVILL